MSGICVGKLMFSLYFIFYFDTGDTRVSRVSRRKRRNWALYSFFH